MNSFAANIADHLKRLAAFAGRESRGHFWPYAGAVLALSFITMFLLMIPPMAESMRRTQQFAAANPDQATVESGPGHYSISIQGHHPELMPDFASMMLGMNAVMAVAVLLLAAAIVRRLHDRGRSGLWALMPLPFLAFASIVTPGVMAASTPDLGLFFALFLNNMIYIGTLVALVVMLAGPSAAGPNKYGETPEGR